MRKTLTLDEDVAIRLERLKSQRGQTFKELVNTVLRAGLDQLETPIPSSHPPYHLEAVALGPRLPNLDTSRRFLSWLKVMRIDDPT
jgi:hypothetical protein